MLSLQTLQTQHQQADKPSYTCNRFSGMHVAKAGEGVLQTLCGGFDSHDLQCLTGGSSLPRLDCACPSGAIFCQPVCSGQSDWFKSRARARRLRHQKRPETPDTSADTVHGPDKHCASTTTGFQRGDNRDTTRKDSCRKRKSTVAKQKRKRCVLIRPLRSINLLVLDRVALENREKAEQVRIAS